MASSAATGLAAEAPIAPGGRIDPLGVSGSYDCTAGPERRVSFEFVAFKDETYEIEQTAASGARAGISRYPWQLATATLVRERVTSGRAIKYRRLTGSLRLLQEMREGQTIAADYAEVSLDGARPAREWRYEIAVGPRAASYAPSGLGEVEVVRIEERRRRYVDAANAPLPLSDASAGFEIVEVSTLSYAPDLGVPLRIERRQGENVLQACSLSAYRHP